MEVAASRVQVPATRYKLTLAHQREQAHRRIIDRRVRVRLKRSHDGADHAARRTLPVAVAGVLVTGCVDTLCK
jgi:hypothetical protein